jgi:two-component system, response regulator PdtaR
MHALLIEDEPLIGMLIEDQLREMGFSSFDFAASEEEALRLAAERCPDLITADHRLASGNGIDAVKVICADQAIPVVFIVGSPQEVTVSCGVKLPKPFTVDQLEQAVREALAAMPSE